MLAAARSSQVFSSSVKRPAEPVQLGEAPGRIAHREDEAHLRAKARRRAELLEARRALGTTARRVVEVGDAAPAADDVGVLQVVGDQELVVPVRLALLGGQVAHQAGADAQGRLRIGGRHEPAVGRDDALDARGGLLQQLLRGQARAREPLDRVERALGGGEGRRAWRTMIRRAVGSAHPPRG